MLWNLHSKQSKYCVYMSLVHVKGSFHVITLSCRQQTQQERRGCFCNTDCFLSISLHSASLVQKPAMQAHISQPTGGVRWCPPSRWARNNAVFLNSAQPGCVAIYPVELWSPGCKRVWIWSLSLKHLGEVRMKFLFQQALVFWIQIHFFEVYWQREKIILNLNKGLNNWKA